MDQRGERRIQRGFHRRVTGQPRWSINNRLQSLKQGVASALTLLFFLLFLLFLLLSAASPPTFSYSPRFFAIVRGAPGGQNTMKKSAASCLRKPVGRIYRGKRIINGERVRTTRSRFIVRDDSAAARERRIYFWIIENQSVADRSRIDISSYRLREPRFVLWYDSPSYFTPRYFFPVLCRRSPARFLIVYVFRYTCVHVCTYFDKVPRGTRTAALYPKYERLDTSMVHFGSTGRDGTTDGGIKTEKLTSPGNSTNRYNAESSREFRSLHLKSTSLRRINILQQEVNKFILRVFI